ncbi:MAG: Na+ dependent nucleoside transporter N-terminal domain-containing protein [Owenweeksia sp.]|nr:Na+ dependent nucleoside transporter N-terminal domain-containing protein [Owenweeksia sp.]
MKKAIVLGFVLLGSLAFQAMGQGLAHRWTFQAISTTNDTSVLTVDSADYFLLKADHSFSYQLKAKDNLKARGRWHREGNTLTLNYELPRDTTRQYRIISHSDTALVLQEEKTKFSFTRPTSSSASLPLKQLPLHYDFTKTDISMLSVARGLLGLVVLLFITYLGSSQRKKISWSLIGKGLALQMILALLLLKVPLVREGFDKLSEGFVVLLSFTYEGSRFLFAILWIPLVPMAIFSPSRYCLPSFSFQLLPVYYFIMVFYRR